MFSVGQLTPMDLNGLATGLRMAQGLDALQKQNMDLAQAHQTLPGQIAAENAHNQGITNTSIPLANAQLGLSQAQVPYLKSQNRALDNRNAMTNATLASSIDAANKANQLKTLYPLMSQPGVAGQMGAYQYLMGHQPQQQQAQPQNLNPLGGAPFSRQIEGQMPSSQPILGQQSSGQTGNQGLANTLLNSLNSSNAKNEALSKYYGVRTSGYGYDKLGASNKNQNIAYAVGMGYKPAEASNLFAKGQTLNDLAAQKGISLDNVQPIYSPTGGSISKMQNRSQATAEISAISPQVTDALAPYARRFAGFSVKQISDSLTGQNPDQSAKYLAARALAPELAGMRMRAQGGQLGIEAIREITDKTYGNLGNFQGSVSPAVFKASQQYLDQWIHQATQSANNQLTNTLGSNNGNGLANKQLGAATAPVIPTFSSKEGFQKWYSGLSPAQQAQAKSHLGGQ